MPNALTFIIGADSQPFATELRRMETIAIQSGRSIGAKLAEGARGGYSGLIREAITIPREIIEGRGAGRIIGSGSLFLQYLSSFIGKGKEAASVASVAAQEFEKMAMKQALLAAAATRTAAAMTAEIDADVGASTADYEAAIAADTNAAAQRALAESYTLRALAASQAAELEALSPIGVTAGAAGIGGLSILGPIALAAAVVTAWFSAASAATGLFEQGLSKLANKAKENAERMKEMAQAEKEADAGRRAANESIDNLVTKEPESIDEIASDKIKEMRRKFERDKKTGKSKLTDVSEDEAEQQVLKKALDEANTKVSQFYIEAKASAAAANDPNLIANAKRGGQYDADKRLADKFAEEDKKNLERAVSSRNALEREITRGKERIEDDKDEQLKQHSRLEHTPVNELQRVGAFARDGGVVDEQKKTNSKLDAIHSAIERNRGGLGRVQH